MGVDIHAARAVTRLAKQAEQALSAVDLTVSQYRVLTVLAEKSGYAGSVASQLAVRPPSLTTVIDGLVARDLVARASDPADGRRQVLTLTALGREALVAGDAAVAARLRELAEVVQGVDDSSAETAVAGLASWNHLLDRVRDERGAVIPE